MVDIGILFNSALTLFILIIPGFVLRKTGLSSDKSAGYINTVLIWVLTPAMLLNSFFKPFDSEEFKTLLVTAGFSLIAHLLFSLISLFMFKKTEKCKKNVYRFAMVFSNAGFMGIPLIVDVLGSDKAIYASFYMIFFHLFIWSVGSYIYTGDMKYFSVKKMILNPGVIPILIGIIIYVTGLGDVMPNIISSAVGHLGGSVVPVSMIIVGLRLAECDFKRIFGNIKLYICFAMRLLILPTLLFAVMYLFKLTNLYYNEIVMASCLICASAPSAAFTNAFAELYGGDGAEASVTVSVSTLLSIVTMPLVAMLLKLI